MTDSEMRRIVIESLPLANGQYDRSMLSQSDKHKSAFSRGLKSSLNMDEYYSIQKRIDEESGKAMLEVITTAKNELNALASVKTTIGNLSASTGAEYGITGVSPMYRTKGEVTLTGAQAVAKARASILSQPSGHFEPIEGKTGMYSYSYLSAYSKNEKEMVDKEKKSLLREARAISNSETKRVINNYNNEVVNGGDSTSANVNGLNGNNVSGNNISIGNGNGEYQRSHLSALLRLIGVATLIAGLVRRILTTVTDFAKQSVEDTVTAHNLNISYDQLREFRYLEKAHGLREGALSGGVSEVEKAFGNITSLDDNKLKALAILVPGISDFVQTGMGGKNPEALMGIIIDAFNKRAKEGVNSVGTYVGEEQARRELYEYLNKIFPSIASVFAVMQEEQKNVNSLYRGMAGTYEEWKRTLSDKSGTLSVTNQGLLYTLGEEANLLTATFAKLKETLSVEFAPALIDLLDKINKSKVFMSEKEKEETGKVAQEKNLAYAKELKGKISSLEGVDTSTLSTKDKVIYKATLETYKKYLADTEKMLDKPVFQQTSVVPTDNMFDEQVGYAVAGVLADAGMLNSLIDEIEYPDEMQNVNLNEEDYKVIKDQTKEDTEKALKQKVLDSINEKQWKNITKAQDIFGSLTPKDNGRYEKKDMLNALNIAKANGEINDEQYNSIASLIKSDWRGAYLAIPNDVEFKDKKFEDAWKEYRNGRMFEYYYADEYAIQEANNTERVKQLKARALAKKNKKHYEEMFAQELQNEATEYNYWTALLEVQDVIDNASVDFSGYNRVYVTTNNVNDNGTIKSEITLHLVGDGEQEKTILMSSKEGQTIFRGEGNVDISTKQITQFNASTD